MHSYPVSNKSFRYFKMVEFEHFKIRLFNVYFPIVPIIHYMEDYIINFLFCSKKVTILQKNLYNIVTPSTQPVLK